MTAAYQTIPRIEAPLALKLEPCPGRRNCLIALLPQKLSPGEVPSLVLYVKQAHFRRGRDLPAVRLGGELLSLTWVSWRRDSEEHFFISSRIGLDGEETRVVIEAADQRLRPRDFRAELFRWQLTARP